MPFSCFPASRPVMLSRVIRHTLSMRAFLRGDFQSVLFPKLLLSPLWPLGNVDFLDLCPRTSVLYVVTVLHFAQLLRETLQMVKGVPVRQNLSLASHPLVKNSGSFEIGSSPVLPCHLQYVTPFS